jgi:hypothetical protein
MGILRAIVEAFMRSITIRPFSMRKSTSSPACAPSSAAQLAQTPPGVERRKNQMRPLTIPAAFMHLRLA